MNQQEIEQKIDELSHAEATEAFEKFKEILHGNIGKCFEDLLLNAAMRLEDEHDLLTKARVYFEMLDIMPGKRWSLYKQLEEFSVKFEKNTEAAREAHLKMKREKYIRSKENWMRIKPQP